MSSISVDSILEESNIEKAIQYLQTKNNSAGTDGVRLSELPEYWKDNRPKITELIHDGQYEPGIVREYEIVSRKGKKRNISLMNAVDRLLCRAAAQILMPAFDPLFSEHCYGFRQGVGAKDMARFAADNIEQGKIWVAELDIKDFFDTIPHELILQKLESLLEDPLLYQLLRAFICCRIENELGIFRMAKGLLQGNNLSPLLSNLFLRDFDMTILERYPSYCRYGDDLRIFVPLRREADEAGHFVRDQISATGLSVNEKKCGSFIAVNRPCLGYEFVQKNQKLLIQQIQRQRPEIYHMWQTSSLKEVSHHWHLTNDGVLTRKDFTILFESEKGKKYIPVEVVDSLSIYSNIVLSGGFFELANKEGFSVNIINRAGDEVGRFIPNHWKRNFKVEMAQIRLLNDEREHLKIAKAYQISNVFNMRAVLRYYARRGHDPLIDSAIQEITGLIRKINEEKSTDRLMIYEAQARQKYYHCFNVIMDDEDFSFIQRTRRPPKDAVNAMMSFGNTLLYTRFANEIYRSALDIRFGLLHSSAKRPENLNLDLADLFKPVLVDRTIFTLVNRRMVDEKRDFEPVGNDGIYMTMRGKRIFIQEFEQKLQQVVEGKNGKKSYSDLIRLEVRKLCDYFGAGIPYKPYKYVN